MATSYNLPLDIIPTSKCSGSYAMTRTSTSYTGPTFNIRRSSDNATSDFYSNAFGQIGTQLDGSGTSLKSWLGTSTAYITTWYDQSGKGNHATQTNTSYQPTFDFTNNQVDFTSGNSFFNLPSGTAPNKLLLDIYDYSSSMSYLSVNPNARTPLITEPASLEDIYDGVLNADVYMNGNSIGNFTIAKYMSNSRTPIVDNQFSVIYAFYNGTDTNCATIIFRLLNNIIDMYQSNAFYYSGNVNDYSQTTYEPKFGVGIGSPGYGVTYFSIKVNPSTYTVIVKHGDINNLTGCWLGSGGSGAIENSTNNFSRTSTGYINSWYQNDYSGNNVYNSGNIVSYGYDSIYSYLFVNGVPQGISTVRSEWSGVKGNEYIGRDNNSANYFNGKMSFLYIFKSFLTTNERSVFERGMNVLNTSGQLKFSQLIDAFGLTKPIKYSQVKKLLGVANNQKVQLSSLGNSSLRNGLFMRYYDNVYFANDPTFFNNNTPTYTGVTTNLRNTYAATCGFNNSNRNEDAMYGINVVAKPIYSVEWTGAFYAPTSGTYTFYLASDDSSYLWLGDNALSGYTTANSLVNSNYNGGIDVSGSMTLVAGQYYPIRIQFGDGGGGEFIRCRFTLPNGTAVYEGTGYFYCQAYPSNQLYTKTVSNTISNTNLSAYFPFELSDQNGTTLLNNATNAYEATLYGGATVSNADYKVGGSSLYLNSASSQYVQTANFTPTTNGLTFSFWYRSNANPSWGRIFDFGNGANVDNILCSPNGDNLNKLGFRCNYKSDPNTNNFYLTDISSYNDNVWRHVVWTLTYAAAGSATSVWNIYINGIYKATNTHYYPETAITRTQCYLGKSNWADPYYNGYIDDFRIYNRVLSSSEIHNIYNSRLFINSVSNNQLIMYYPFETSDKSGTTLANNANPNNIVFDATLYGGATVSIGDYKVGLSLSSLSLSDASSQYVQTANFTSTTNGLTFSFWYKSNGSGTNVRVFDFGNGQENNNILCVINAYGANQLALYCSNETSSTTPLVLSDITSYNDNVWRHITWTLTYASAGSQTSTWKVYIDGVFKKIFVGYYPLTTVTRTLCYIGKTHWSGTGYFNGYIDDFRVYNRVLSAAEIKNVYSYKNNTIYTYSIKNGAQTITTQIQGTTPQNPATSGYAMYLSNPWLPNNYYWIKSASMKNAVQMYVDIKNGGFDYYHVNEGMSVNDITLPHSGTQLGLELMVPRSQTHWKSIYDYIYNVLGSNYTTYLKTINIYKTASYGNYSGYAMFDQRYGNSGSTTGSYNGAPDWRTKDGGLWYLKDIPFSEPNGDYFANAFLGTFGDVDYTYGIPYMTSYNSPGFNDGNAVYYTGSNYIVSTNYAGSTVSTLYTYLDGSTADRAAPSALYIKNQTGTNDDGVYWINLPTVGPTQVYCIMNSAVDGGGWMMAMKATTGSTFQYSSSHWTTVTTLNPSDNTRNNADAKFHTMNYFKCKDMLALWPDIPYNYTNTVSGVVGTGGSLSLPTYNNWCWIKNNYKYGVRQTLINYFSTATNVSFGVAKGVERGTAFSSQSGNNFYGINFTLNQAGLYRHVRWGFGWNEQTDWGSNDSTGGIGMNNPAYSAGDYAAYQDQTGINRSARVEMYVR
jgi:hypothetical protein